MPTINEKFYREIRCPDCHRLLGYEYVFAGRLAFYCSRCGELVEQEYKHMGTKANVTEVQKDFTIKPSTN